MRARTSLAMLTGLGRRGYTVREEPAEYAAVEVDPDSDPDPDWVAAEHAIGDEGVEVDIAAERGAAALNRSDSASAAVGDATVAGAPAKPEQGADDPRVPRRDSEDPRALDERRIVAHVLLVLASELGDPVRLLVAVEPGDRPLHLHRG